MNIQAIFREMTPRARIGLAAAVLGVVAVSFFLLKMATAPSYQTIMTGMSGTTPGSGRVQLPGFVA
ncbi:MAG: hypothetical protein REI11_11435 [Patulibacter sp.]|nr:hypothetical protein [Patulibacter sp.]